MKEKEYQIRNDEQHEMIIDAIIFTCSEKLNISIKWEYMNNVLDKNQIRKYKDIDGIFIKPNDAKQLVNIEEPLILVNSQTLNDEDAFLGSIAHECRHCYQFYHQDENEEWKKEFYNPVKKLNDDGTPNNNYFSSALELDAYVFQELFLRDFFDNPKLKIYALNYFDKKKVKECRKKLLTFFK